MTGSLIPSILLTGFLAGTLSGLLGLGGGTIIVPALVLLLGLGQQLSQGIALAVFIPTAALGAYHYYKKGFVKLDLAWLLAAGALTGVILGSIGAAHIPAAQLQRIFGLFMIAISISFLRRK